MRCAHSRVHAVRAARAALSGTLRSSYTLLAPVYDWVAGPAFAAARQKSLAALPATGELQILINGAGTGLDLPFLPAAHRYVALDVTAAMLRRATQRSAGRHVAFVQGDCHALPFHDASFDLAVLHLILAVVPDPVQALRETARVLRPGSSLLIFDKFLRRGARAPLRRALSPLAGRFVTRTDVVLEDLAPAVPGLEVASNEAALAGGWFRRVIMRKR